MDLRNGLSSVSRAVPWPMFTQYLGLGNSGQWREPSFRVRQTQVQIQVKPVPTSERLTFSICKVGII